MTERDYICSNYSSGYFMLWSIFCESSYVLQAECCLCYLAVHLCSPWRVAAEKFKWPCMIKSATTLLAHTSRREEWCTSQRVSCKFSKQITFYFARFIVTQNILMCHGPTAWSVHDSDGFLSTVVRPRHECSSLILQVI